MRAARLNRQLRGVGISPGFAIGTAYIYRDVLDQDYRLYSLADGQIDREFDRIKRAFEAVLNDLVDLTRRVERDLDAETADIFRAHRVLLKDSSLLGQIRTELERERTNAEYALKSVFDRLKSKFDNMEDPLLRDRADDVVDLCKRLLRSLLGVQSLLEKLPADAVLIAQRLLPSDTVLLQKHAISAVVVEHCGTASHSAILARGIGIPVVSHIENATGVIATGNRLLVDGCAGQVVLAPDRKRTAAFATRAQKYRVIQARAKERCTEPALTRDGARVFVLANIGSILDAALARENGADGVGLFRLEQFFLAEETLPRREDVQNVLRQTLAQMPGVPATVRLLDVGADKRLPYLKQRDERNPMLGRRGVRLLLDYPELLTSQLWALLAVSQEFPLRILVPMVTLEEDMRLVRTAATNVAKELGLKSIPPLGAMIETPAAALCVQRIAECADFLCVGTNDLTQYVMAASREEDFLSHYYIEDHPAVINLIRWVCESVPQHDIEICGELAGRVKTLPAFLEMGVRRFSVVPLRVPAIKETVRTLTMRTLCVGEDGSDRDQRPAARQAKRSD